MLYLFDANALIQANQDYYALDRFPQFWDWLLAMGAAGSIKIPLENHEEVSHPEALKDWLAAKACKEQFVLGEEVDRALLQRVLDDGYAQGGARLTDEDVEKVGRDPFLIAYALASPADRAVVTKEVSKPTVVRANRRIPDVCNTLGIQCVTDFAVYRALNFTMAGR